MSYKYINTEFDFSGITGVSPKFLEDIFNLGGWVCGSFALRLLDKSVTAHDLDIFCPDMQTFYTLKHFICGHSQFDGKFKDMDRYIEFRMNDKRRKSIVQVVRPNLITSSVPDTPEDILDRIDFSVCRVLMSSLNTMIIDEDLFEHLLQRKLVFRIGVHSELQAKRALWRLSKYINKGFSASKYDLIRILSYLNDVPREALCAIGSVIRTQGANIICDESLKRMYNDFMQSEKDRNGFQSEEIKKEFIRSEEEWQNGNARPWKGLA